MHEANFTQEIVSAILGELEHYPVLRPKLVKVKVGEMLHLIPDSVLMHYRQMTKGTHLEGAVLQLTETPVQVRCPVCSFTGGVEDHHMLLCSKCGSRDVELIQGKEITIESIEMTDLPTMEMK